MVETFDAIVERLEENADEKLVPEVLDVDGSEPHIFLTLDAPTQISRREFLQKLGGDIERESKEVVFKFLDAARTSINGKDGVRYRLRVDDVEGNPFEEEKDE